MWHGRAEKKTFVLLPGWLLFFPPLLKSVYTCNSYCRGQRLTGECLGFMFYVALLMLVKCWLGQRKERRITGVENCNWSFMCFFFLPSLGLFFRILLLLRPHMIYALCTIKRMFGYHALTCIFMTALPSFARSLVVLIRSERRDLYSRERRFLNLLLWSFCRFVITLKKERRDTRKGKSEGVQKCMMNWGQRSSSPGRRRKMPPTGR